MERNEFNKTMDELFEDVGIDIDGDGASEATSLTYMQLITSIEDEFDVELPDQFLVKDSLNNLGLFKDMVFELLSAT